jgi:hypothetical protein
MKLEEALKRSYEMCGRLLAIRYESGMLWIFDAEEKRLVKCVGFDLDGEPLFNLFSTAPESLEDYDDWISDDCGSPDETDT